MWTEAEQTYLRELLIWRAAANGRDSLIGHPAFEALCRRLASEKGVKRYQAVVNHAHRQQHGEPDYLEWLNQVLQGFDRFQPVIEASRPTPDGPLPSLHHTLQRIVARAYRRIYGYSPTPDHCEGLVSRVLLSLHESYFYDTELESWLWQTARNLILNDLRREAGQPVSDLETTPEIKLPSGPQDFTRRHLQREDIQAAIRQVQHQRYRLILLLLYLYELENTELAAFFGVSVPRVTTWRSRALAAFRQHYDPL